MLIHAIYILHEVLIHAIYIDIAHSTAYEASVRYYSEFISYTNYSLNELTVGPRKSCSRVVHLPHTLHYTSYYQ